MGFLDNLEDSLKNLESDNERDSSAFQRRQDDRAKAILIAPWAEKLKDSDYTKQLFDKAAIAGHRTRTKVYMAWLDNTLRLEAKGRRLELRPASDGIFADFVEPDGRTNSKLLDLDSDPQALVDEWLG